MTPPAPRIVTAGLPSGRQDILIVGAGLAALFLALRLSPRPCRILSPSPLGQASSSAWAQGGLAAALDPDDSPEAHARDTVSAGAGLVDPSIAQLIATEGPDRVRDLLTLGVPFDRTETGALALSLEAAHSRPRVARVAGDLAGKAIMDALVAAVRATPSIETVEGVRAVALLADTSNTVAGCAVRDHEGALTPLIARETVLCTGGIGGLFEVTTNPQGARGDALAMAADVGALIADPEFVQFHPTALDIGRDPAPLATEALRGEGAILVNANGEPFMARYHTDAELAPRDEVARAIHAERAAGRGAFLDTRQAVGKDFPEHFPTVYAACQSAGIDPVTELLPVAPAAHYHMGGITSDVWGKTSVDGLSACGECASTGAHGANRLASNSLLEAVVFAHRIAERLQGTEMPQPGASEGIVTADLPVAALAELRGNMARHCGVVRNAKGLTALLDKIEQAKAEHGPARALTAARLITEAALNRQESRGGHFRSDYPDTSAPQRTYVGMRPTIHQEHTPA